MHNSLRQKSYKRDLPKVEVHLLDTGHFALETHAEEIARLTLEFLRNAIPEKAERLR